MPVIQIPSGAGFKITFGTVVSKKGWNIVYYKDVVTGEYMTIERPVVLITARMRKGLLTRKKFEFRYQKISIPSVTVPEVPEVQIPKISIPSYEIPKYSVSFPRIEKPDLRTALKNSFKKVTEDNLESLLGDWGAFNWIRDYIVDAFESLMGLIGYNLGSILNDVISKYVYDNLDKFESEVESKINSAISDVVDKINDLTSKTTKYINDSVNETITNIQGMVEEVLTKLRDDINETLSETIKNIEDSINNVGSSIVTSVNKAITTAVDNIEKALGIPYGYLGDVIPKRNITSSSFEFYSPESGIEYHYIVIGF